MKKSTKENRKEWYKKNREKEIKRVLLWRLKKYGDAQERIRLRREEKDRYKEERLAYKIFMKDYGNILYNSINQKYFYYFKKRGYKNPNDKFKILGCSLKEYKKFIEANFKENMNWSNYGHSGWVIRFIKKPTYAENKIEFLELCNYKNTRPEWQ